MFKEIAVGIDDFYMLRMNDSFYVDKSLLIRDIVNTGAAVTLLTRPRRFGKTLNMSMLKYFFEHPDCRIHEMQAENREVSYLFEDLAIWQAGSKYQEEQGKYPVIFLTLKNVKAKNWEEASLALKNIIANEYKRHKYLLDGNFLDDQEKEVYTKIMNRDDDLSMKEYSSIIESLSRYLYLHFKKRTIVLIDEYDTPIQHAYLNNYFEDAIDFMRDMLTKGLKGNFYLQKGVLTGIMKVAKESIFSDFNNPDVATLLNYRYSSYFGFTEEEVLSMVKYYKLEEHMPQITEWYDGYLFGDNLRIYNPWSILNYIANHAQGFKPYWVNTSSNEIIKEVLQLNKSESKKNIEKLLNGETIKTSIDEHVVYQSITQTSEASWSFLLHAGYLKMVHSEFVEALDKYIYDLAIVNREVRIIFKVMLKRYFTEDLKVSDDMLFLVRYLLEGDIKSLEELIQNLYLTQVSCFDLPPKKSQKKVTSETQILSQENFHHGFILGLFMFAAEHYEVKSNREYGLGRPDLVLIPRDKEKRAYLFELKYETLQSEVTVEGALKKAKAQIVDKKYREGVKGMHSLEKITAIAVGFKGKNVKFEVMES